MGCVYIRTTVIVSADFIENENRRKPISSQSRGGFFSPLSNHPRIHAPGAALSHLLRAGYSGRIHHSALLRGRVMDAAGRRGTRIPAML
jgi:hypothetical protein